VSHATGEIIIFTDTRQRLEPGAVEKLLENFADCNVGCVSGELHFETEGTPGLKATMYWKYERWLRHEESRIGCCMGATGAFYAIRRTLFRPLPDGLILDDVFTPLQIALQGYRVIHDARAVVWDVEAKDETQEFRRKVRTLMGNYQLLKYLPGLLRPGKIGFQFFSHKTIRLLAPLFLVTAFVSNWFLQGAFYRAALVAQCAFYLAAALGPLVPRGWPQVMGIPRAFVVLNSAALLAMINYFRGKSAVWKN
jgi:cellulose synthase/poly-beta-1,6-N-acetylglucosamine synthase-like glycosyltransferase